MSVGPDAFFGVWHPSALRTPIVKSGRANPVLGIYATGTSHRVQFSWNLSPCSVPLERV